MNVLERLMEKELVHPPKWMRTNTNYLCYMGSVAYGVNNDTSDMDVYGFCTPPLRILLPHTQGIIPGFGNQGEKFDVWQEHHIQDKEQDKQYDMCIYSIVRFFQLCMENNPNMVDSLFVPRRCILYSDKIGELVRENRHLFLHKGCWHKFKGYAYSQLHKMQSENRTGKRADAIKQHGFDVKFAYHSVRLMLEVEQILTEHTLDLERNSEILKSIRRGEWSLDKIKLYFEDKEKYLEKVYAESTLPWTAEEQPIKDLLVKCINMTYSEIKIHDPNEAEIKLDKIRKILET